MSCLSTGACLQEAAYDQRYSPVKCSGYPVIMFCGADLDMMCCESQSERLLPCSWDIVNVCGSSWGLDSLLPSGCDLIFGDSPAPVFGRKESLCIENIPYQWLLPCGSALILCLSFLSYFCLHGFSQLLPLMTSMPTLCFPRQNHRGTEIKDISSLSSVLPSSGC